MAFRISDFSDIDASSRSKAFIGTAFIHVEKGLYNSGGSNRSNF